MILVTVTRASPNIYTILRQSPTSERTSADTLTWLLTFTEPVTELEPADFAVSGTTATLALTPLALDEEGCSVQWHATLSGGDLADLNRTVTLNIADNYYIWGCLGDGEEMTHPGPNSTNHNTFVLENSGAPTPPPSPPSPLPPVITTSGSDDGDDAPRTPAPVPTPEPLFSASNSAVTVTEREDAPGQFSLVFQRHDQPGAVIAVQIGWISQDGSTVIASGFVRDGDLGQTYAIVRREGDGQVVRRWIAPDSPLVYAVPWATVNTQYTFPVEVILAIPLDDQYPPPQHAHAALRRRG